MIPMLGPNHMLRNEMQMRSFLNPYRPPIAVNEMPVPVNDGNGVISIDRRKILRRAANRKSAQLSRARKKVRNFR